MRPGLVIERCSSMDYEIKVDGELDPRWSDWFEGITLLEQRASEASFTTVSVSVPDQSALRGILNALWDLNLNLVSVTRQEA